MSSRALDFTFARALLAQRKAYHCAGEGRDSGHGLAPVKAAHILSSLAQHGAKSTQRK